MLNPISCPACRSQRIRKAGILRRKKMSERQQYQCKCCFRVFVLETSKPGPDVGTVIISGGSSTRWKQRTFRSAPDLDPYIDRDPESFQKIVDRCLRRRYKILKDLDSELPLRSRNSETKQTILRNLEMNIYSLPGIAEIGDFRYMWGDLWKVVRVVGIHYAEAGDYSDEDTHFTNAEITKATSQELDVWMAKYFPIKVLSVGERHLEIEVERTLSVLFENPDAVPDASLQPGRYVIDKAVIPYEMKVEPARLGLHNCNRNSLIVGKIVGVDNKIYQSDLAIWLSLSAIS